MIEIGQSLPDARLFEMTDDGPQERSVAELFDGKTVALFGTPGAFTPTCHMKHLPTFIEKADALRTMGVDEIICVSVNDPFVMGHWGEISGASAAGIRMIADPGAELVGGMGVTFDGSARGLGVRSQRFAAIVRERDIGMINVEKNPGVAETTTAQALLEEL